MSKINELFEVISKHQKEHGVRPDKIKLRKNLYDELEDQIKKDTSGIIDHKKERKNLSKYDPVCSFFNGIRIETMEINDALLGNDVEIIAVINDRYVYSRITEGNTAKWSVMDLGPSLWDNKFPEYGNLFNDWP